MNVCGIWLAYPSFIVRSRRARVLSLAGSITSHLVAIMLLLSGAAGMFELAGADRQEAQGQAKDMPAQTIASNLQMVELPAAVTLDAVQGTRLDQSFYRELMRKEIKDTRNLSARELQQKLNSLSRQAAGISGDSLAQIGRLLGMNPGKYRVRTYYQDELNPNINFHHARVTRTFCYRMTTGEAGYTITLADREHDEFTFTLEGKPAREFEHGGLRFKDKTLFGKTNNTMFELNGARVKNIQRLIPVNNPDKTSGSVVTMVDPRGNIRRFNIQGSRNTPLVLAQIAFARGPGGKFLLDPEKETTFFTSLVDTSTMTLWSVNPVKPAEDDKNKLPVARVVMLDAKGNRLIYFVKGKDARDMLSRASVLGQNRVAQKIYQKTGFAGYLLKLYQQEPRKRKQKAKPKKQ